LIGDEPHGVLRKRHRHCRHRAAFDHEQQRPAVEKRDERMIRVAEIHVLSARGRQHRAQLRVRQRSDQRNHRARHPGADHELGRLQTLSDDVRIDEDAGTDDAADDDHRRVERSKRALERLTHASAA
jgi:hypothetical protein